MMSSTYRSVADVIRDFALDSKEGRVAVEYFHAGGHAIAFAFPFDPSRPAPRDVTKEALAFMRDNEWGGHTVVNGERVPCCLDCGAVKGEEHSPDACRWLSTMKLAGER